MRFSLHSAFSVLLVFYSDVLTRREIPYDGNKQESARLNIEANYDKREGRCRNRCGCAQGQPC